MKDELVLKNFRRSEFTMRGQNVFDRMDRAFLLSLDRLREDVRARCAELSHADIPFIVRSSFRTREENTRVGGAPSSMHLRGRAVDIWVNSQNTMTGRQRAIIIECALKIGFSVGIMRGALHFDNRDTQVIFTYPQAEFTNEALH
jgi:hypothetical protein